MPRGNPSPKHAITINPGVHEKILEAAAHDRVSVSAWTTNTAREALQRRAGLAAIAEWEEQHGPFSQAEMAQARGKVGKQLQTPGGGSASRVSAVVYNAPVLVAVDRNDRRTWAEHKARLEFGIVPLVHTPVVAQVPDRRNRPNSGAF